MATALMPLPLGVWTGAMVALVTATPPSMESSSFLLSSSIFFSEEAAPRAVGCKPEGAVEEEDEVEVLAEEEELVSTCVVGTLVMSDGPVCLPLVKGKGSSTPVSPVSLRTTGLLVSGSVNITLLLTSSSVSSSVTTMCVTRAMEGVGAIMVP